MISIINKIYFYYYKTYCYEILEIAKLLSLYLKKKDISLIEEAIKKLLFCSYYYEIQEFERIASILAYKIRK